MILVLFVTFLVIAPAKAQSFLYLSGKTVSNKSGLPTPSLVCVDVPPCRECTDQILECVPSNPDGTFSIHASIAKNFRGFALVAAFKDSESNFGLLLSDSLNAKNHPLLARKILVNDRALTKKLIVKDLRIIELYKQFDLDLGALVPELEEVTLLPEKMRFTVKAMNGKVIRDNIVIEKQFWDMKRKFVHLQIPKGKWRVSLRLLDEMYKNVTFEFVVNSTTAEAGIKRLK